MNSDNYPLVRSNKPLRDFEKGEHFFVRLSKSGFTQTALCSFIEIEKGFVVGEVLQHFYPDGHAPMQELAKGSIVRKRAKHCFLWFKGEKYKWPRCHWFQNLDEPVS